MRHYNIPIFIAHIGCPHTCVFCNQNKITGLVTDTKIDEIAKIIEEHLETLPKESKKEVAFFGGSFTGLPIDLQEQYLKEAYKFIKEGLVDGIRLSTRPDYINREVLNLLKLYKVSTIELGVQSFDQNVLDQSERGHSYVDIIEASKLIKEYNITLGIQLMPGLPGSTYESDVMSAISTAKLSPDIARIYPTLVISNTELERMYNRKDFIPLDIEEAVRRSVTVLSILENNKINVIRVGLQPSDDLREEGVIIAGPFHPAFRELVEGEIVYRFLKKLLIKEKKLEVEVSIKDISRFLGIKKINKIKLEDIVEFKLNKELEKGKYLINGKEYVRAELIKNIISEEWSL